MKPTPLPGDGNSWAYPPGWWKKLERDAMALLWSAIAAGLSMALHYWQKGYFMSNWKACRAVLAGESRLYLWFYYRHYGPPELFTENTVTAVLPVMQKPTMATLAYLCGYGASCCWVIFSGRYCGVGIWIYANLQWRNSRSFVKIGMDVMKNTPSEMFANRSFPAGWSPLWYGCFLQRVRKDCGDYIDDLAYCPGWHHSLVVGSVEILYLVFNGTLHWSISSGPSHYLL